MHRNLCFDCILSTICLFNQLFGVHLFFSVLGRSGLLPARLREFSVSCLLSAQRGRADSSAKKTKKHQVLALDHGVDLRTHGNKFDWLLPDADKVLWYQDVWTYHSGREHAEKQSAL